MWLSRRRQEIFEQKYVTTLGALYNEPEITATKLPGELLMCEQWMPSINLRIELEDYRKLPRHPAFKYEFFNGQAFITPKARFYHARLELADHLNRASKPSMNNVDLFGVSEKDFPELEKLFTVAFASIQPFAGLNAENLEEASHQCLQRTQSGGDGCWLKQASFLARTKPDSQLIGAILITLLHDSDSWESGNLSHRTEVVPESWSFPWGRPHLTWIYVDPLFAGQGVGTVLLDEAATRLKGLGYQELLTTFLVGNVASMLWHWKNGFELISNLTSPSSNG